MFKKILWFLVYVGISLWWTYDVVNGNPMFSTGIDSVVATMFAAFALIQLFFIVDVQ